MDRMTQRKGKTEKYVVVVVVYEKSRISFLISIFQPIVLSSPITIININIARVFVDWAGVTRAVPGRKERETEWEREAKPESEFCLLFSISLPFFKLYVMLLLLNDDDDDYDYILMHSHSPPPSFHFHSSFPSHPKYVNGSTQQQTISSLLTPIRILSPKHDFRVCLPFPLWISLSLGLTWKHHTTSHSEKEKCC